LIDPISQRTYHPTVQPVISSSQMREIDCLTTRHHKTPSLLLMQSAAKACFQAIETHFGGNISGLKAQILCGQGNNGGDGAALAQELSRAEVKVNLVLFGKVSEAKGDARTNFEIVRQMADPEVDRSPAATTHPSGIGFIECNSVAGWEELARPRRTYDFIVDALFGTGLNRPLEGVFVQVIQHLALIRRARERASGARPLIVSVDVPSGLNADLATPIGEAVHADLTVTFTAPKPANVLPPSSHLNGKLIVADIGSPASLVEGACSRLFLTEENDARDWLINTRYKPDSFKNSHGHVMVVAGSRGYTGAAVLCGNAAMRSGAGLVTIATPVSAQAIVAASVMPEVMTTAVAETDRGAISDEAIDHVNQLAAKASVVAIGPGLSSEDERTRNFVLGLVQARTKPIVIDADALNCLSKYSASGWPTDLVDPRRPLLILTPHPGEMLRLLGTTDKSILEDRVSVVRDFATKHNLILVLKGTRALIAGPDGRVFINPTGNAGLGTAGSGDTLTGIIAGFVAQSVGAGHDADVLSATAAALYIGGLAGDLAARQLGMRTMVASDIREHLGEAICSLDATGEMP
jgi:NAD(P)H-hydrate epimerase